MASLSPTILDKISGVRVLVIGDMMLDHYIWGDVHRISPEAPVPVVYAERDTYTAGGAANVSLNLANLGVSTSILGYCGKDEAGRKLHAILNKHQVNVLCKNETEDIPTIIKTRVIVRNQQLCRLDREAKQSSYCIETAPRFDDILYAALQSADAVIISDYAKGVITQSLIDKLQAFSEENPHILITVDPKPTRQLSYRGAGLLTPNRNEALLLAGIPEPYPDHEYPLAEVCSRIHEKYSPNILVITLGADGMAVCQEGKVLKHIPTEAKEVFDVSGAGDTVIATITAAMSAGVDIIEAAQLANVAAACVVSHVGTVPVVLNELEEKLAKRLAENYAVQPL
ncbi:bifunctional heptose 7-phosphate kinase/heptose 1-phosphate adenyltransferase [Telluribacter sp. SYSU D00476]|uniref:bifunctional heptose 7-phosphate kinase/heptose 1-phosphate adenyltransferase n=1 Tax=Telluribacter sp. SYSU D00476 TaxID=2811430 RepID=UPI001FF3ADA5|nr:bifunctional ADP-heptose synthase [Telluribacter sp. SYSU D00476]